MEPDQSALAPSLQNSNNVVASPRKKSIRVVSLIVYAVTAGVLGAFLLWGIPYTLPYLKPLTVYVSYRLREVSIFLLFTTITAIGIFNSPRKAGNRQKASPDPLPSIFSESGGSEMIKYVLEGANQHQRTRLDDYGTSSAKVYSAVNLAGKSDAECVRDANSSRKAEDITLQSLQSKATEGHNFPHEKDEKMVAASTERATPNHWHNSSASREDGHQPVYDGDPQSPAPLITQRKLHRKSGSLDDSVNFKGAPVAESTRSQANAEVCHPSSTSVTEMPSSGPQNKAKSDVGRTKSGGLAKKVSFSIDQVAQDEKSQDGEKPVPLSSNSVSQSTRTGSLSNKVLPRSDIVENTVGRVEKRSSLSPNELDKKADAFIARFKEQIRMQKLDSFQKYRRRHA